MFPSYRNQSVDLQSKSTDWFLYDGNIGRRRVKQRLVCILTDLEKVILSEAIDFKKEN